MSQSPNGYTKCIALKGFWSYTYWVSHTGITARQQNGGHFGITYPYPIPTPPDSVFLDDTYANVMKYHTVSNISGTWVGNKIVDQSGVVGASPVGAAPLHLHSQLIIWLQWIGQRQLQDETRNIYVLGLGASYIRELTVMLTVLALKLKAVHDHNRNQDSPPQKHLYSTVRSWKRHRAIWRSFRWWEFAVATKFVKKDMVQSEDIRV